MKIRRYFSPQYYQRSTDALNLGLHLVPMYHSWQKHDPGEHVSIDKRYAAMATVTKKELRQHFPYGLIPRHRDLIHGLKQGEIEFVETSGTTEERIRNIWHQPWWNNSESASWKLNANTAQLTGSHREAILTSALNVGFRSSHDLSFPERRLDRFLFLNEKASIQEWHPYHYARLAHELAMFQPEILEANPSWLARFAWWAREKSVPLYQPRMIIFTYELSAPMHLRSIREVFPVPMASSYGCTEAGYVFMQCEHGTFHQNTDYCRVDFQPLKPQHGGPAIGRILLTTLQNPWMTLLRFDVGDLVRLDDSHACACGRDEGLLLRAIEGRLANATFTTAGHMVTTRQVDDALAIFNTVRDYQLVQQAANEYHLKLIMEIPSATILKTIRAALRLLYGPDARVEIEACPELEPTASGKYRRTQATFPYDTEGLCT